MRKIVLAGILTVAVLGVLAVPEAKAGGPSSFGLSIQTPGFGFNYRQGYPVYGRPVLVAPPVVVPAPVVVSPPVLVPANGGWYGGYSPRYPHHHHHHHGYPYGGPYRGGWR